MKKQKKKNKIYLITGFICGLIIYLVGLFLLFGASLTRLEGVKRILPDIIITRSTLLSIKIFGAILFLIGFVIFMISVILLYKEDKIRENVKELIIEGRADVITIIVMTYILIFMLVICLIFDEVIGALLFGIAILIQSVLNNFLLRYYRKK